MIATICALHYANLVIADIMTPPNNPANEQDQRHAPYVFFALVFALSIPFWVLGAVTDRMLMPGLPLSSLMVVCPALAALILRWRASGRQGVLALLARAVDVWRFRSLGFIALLLIINPALYLAAFTIQRAIGVDVPAPNIQLGPLLILLAIFLIAATAEELGWTGYALDPLQRRWGMLRSGLILGLACAAWHLVALDQADRSVDWVIWWAIGTVAARVLMVWLYNQTGQSVFGMSIYHAISNLCWQMYPVQGSYFDPQIDALLTIGVVILVLWAWPGKHRSGSASPS